MKSCLFLGIQLVAIGYLLLTGPLIVRPAWVGLELIAVYLLAWAVLTMKPKHINPLPNVRRNARLVTRGPYRFIRHPMYTASLLLATAWVLDKPTLGRVLVGVILTADLLAKAAYEEELLGRRFPEYAGYRRRTQRFLPFVY